MIAERERLSRAIEVLQALDQRTSSPELPDTKLHRRGRPLGSRNKPKVRGVDLPQHFAHDRAEPIPGLFFFVADSGTVVSTSLKPVPKCILLAGDEPVSRHDAMIALSDAGYSVLEARDGIAALQIAQQHESAIDMLITDVHMPGMGGHDLAREVMKLRSNVCVLMMSDGRESDFPPEALGCAAILKTIESKRLVQRVQGLLASPRNSPIALEPPPTTSRQIEPR
jgi:CheY-like chemotaxis protein